MSTTIPQLSKILQTLLIEDANRLGRTSGFIQRQRKVTGSSFAQSLVFGWQSNPKASLEELCQTACASGVMISPQGLQERLNSPQAATFMKQVLERALSYVVTSEGKRHDLLTRFTGVYIQDSTIIELPLVLRELWAGCGNQNGKKNLVLTFSVVGIKTGRRGRNEEIVKPVMMIDPTIEFVSG